ncbi:MAG: hypothetical protein AUJ52_05980, partial [Elusimicrobia bacterium CG1_02_63_36]
MRRPLLFVAPILLFAGCFGSAPPMREGGRGAAVAAKARSQSGVRYRFGGRSPDLGFDCSGLAWWSHRQAGIPIPPTTRTQYRSGRRIQADALQPGDLVFFATVKRSVSHVGVYQGHGKFIHAPTSGKGVRAGDMSNPYWKKRYLGA